VTDTTEIDVFLEPVAYTDLDTGPHAKSGINTTPVIIKSGLIFIHQITHKLTREAEVEQGFGPEE